LGRGEEGRGGSGKRWMVAATSDPGSAASVFFFGAGKFAEHLLEAARLDGNTLRLVISSGFPPSVQMEELNEVPSQCIL